MADALHAADPRVADLVEAGKVRVALYSPQYIKDPLTGELRGWCVDLVRALGERLDIAGEVVEHLTPLEAIASLRTGICDVSILGIDPTRAAEVDYSPPFAELDFTYLVPGRSSICRLADADRPGVRITVVRNHVSTLTLTRALRRATLVYAEMWDTAFDLLRTGQADAFASVRAELAKFAPQMPGSRLLAASYGTNQLAIAVAKDCARGRLPYMSEFIEEAKASGLVQRAIDDSGLTGTRVVGVECLRRIHNSQSGRR